jgi:outer membrane protein
MFLKSTQTTTLLLVFLIQACTSPLDTSSTAHPPPVKSATPEEITRNTTATELDTVIALPSRHSTQVEDTLKHRIDELNQLAPANNNTHWAADIGFDLHKNEASSLNLSIEDAVGFAIKNNLDIEIASFGPAVSKQATISAEAAFDFVLGAGASKKRSRIPQQQVIGAGGVPLSSTESIQDMFSSDASLVKKLHSGGSFSLSTDITKTDSQSSGFAYTPDPAWRAIGTVELTQPLLRNFGEKVTLSQVRVSLINESISIEDVRKTLNTTISLTEKNYLDLCLQWKKLQVGLWLLEQGEQVVEILELRRSYDTNEADYAQAVATVQKRRADVIQQQSAVHSASDTLKKTMNTSEYPLDSESVIQPTGTLSANPISISLRQALMTAIENRPDLRSLSLQIESSAIDVEVKDNARLPQLDMQAQMSFYGLGDSANAGYNEVFDTDYLNYLVGLTFQIPLGNRAAEANYQSSRLQKMSAVSTYKSGVQQATIEVKTALRNTVTSAVLAQANKSFRIAQTENLRALLVEEETMAGLTPTFLNLKLQTQAGLASARAAEIKSVVEYNKSISSLYEAMGVSSDQHQVSVEEVIYKQ